MKKIKFNKTGYTLIELIIVLFLIQIIFTISYFIYFYAIRNYNIDFQKQDNISNVRISMNHISKNLRRSNKVSIKNNRLYVGEESYRLASNNILYNKNNQLGLNIGEFEYRFIEDNLIYIKISSVADEKYEGFSLESHFYIYD